MRQERAFALLRNVDVPACEMMILKKPVARLEDLTNILWRAGVPELLHAEETQ